MWEPYEAPGQPQTNIVGTGMFSMRIHSRGLSESAYCARESYSAVFWRELFSPPWRVLLTALCKMELRGTICGGRFAAGVDGDQFAQRETVDALRKFKKPVNSNKPRYCNL